MKQCQRYSISSKKGASQTIAKLVSYLIIILVIFVALIAVVKPDIKGIIDKFTDSQLDKLGSSSNRESYQHIATGDLYVAFTSQMRDLTLNINKYKDEDNCVIKLDTPLERDLVKIDNLFKGVHINFQNDSQKNIYLVLARDATTTPTSFKLEGITGVRLLRDSEGFVKKYTTDSLIKNISSSKIYGRRAGGRPSSTEFIPTFLTMKTRDETSGECIKIDGKNYCELDNSYFKRLSSPKTFPLYEEGKLKSLEGSDDLLSTNYILKVNKNLYLYNGDVKWPSSNIELNSNTVPESILCKEPNSQTQTSPITP